MVSPFVKIALVFSVGLLLGFQLQLGLKLQPFHSATWTTNAATKEERPPPPLIVSPLLKELGAGWGNMQTPPLLHKKAEGTRSLIVDVGLDQGSEFFLAVKNGFEVVGFEANPISFASLAKQCEPVVTCHVISDLTKVSLPLKREPGQSYLVHSALGKERTELELVLSGALSTFYSPGGETKSVKRQRVPVNRLDDIIQEDVYLFKIDTQGYDHFVLEGAANLFQNHVVRQVIFEVDPLTMRQNNLTITDTIKMVQLDYGLLCFQDRIDQLRHCQYYGDTAQGFENKYFGNIQPHESGLFAQCWEDFLCINIAKVYAGPVLAPALR